MEWVRWPSGYAEVLDCFFGPQSQRLDVMKLGRGCSARPSPLARAAPLLRLTQAQHGGTLMITLAC